MNPFSLKTSKIQAFLDSLIQEKSILLDRLSVSMKAFLIFHVFTKTKKNILVITSQSEKDRLYLSLKSFLKESLLELPAWETLPGDKIQPSPDVMGKRFETLQKLCSNTCPYVVICPYASFLQKLVPPEFLHKFFQSWHVGEEVFFEKAQELFQSLGYRAQNLVTDKGQYAMRGGIIDIFPSHLPDPYRIEFFGDTIESIRTFDPLGQKSLEKKQSFFLPPANEAKILSSSKVHVSVLDYLSKDTFIVLEDLLEIEDAYVQLKKILEGKSFSFHELLENAASNPQLLFSSKNIEELTSVQPISKNGIFSSLSFEMFTHQFYAKKFPHPLLSLEEFFQSFEDLFIALKNTKEKSLQILFLIEHDREKKIIEEKLKGALFQMHFEKGYINEGFVIADIPYAIIPFSDFTKKKKIRRQKWRNTYHTPVSEFHALSPGDLVVHFHSGIGKYLGVEKQVNHEKVESEFMVIEFAENSKLFVPLNQSHLVSRYIGSDESTPTLHKIGEKRWQTTKNLAQKQILGYASELLQVYAEREIEGGFSYPHDSEITVQFAEEFPYIETPDQLIAIREIQSDMHSEKAMDRLLCGDVGYGKTEVAMRAAFKAVVDGQKQVAILVPTTVLASQHYENFCQRMGQYPLSVEMLSRFRSAKETKNIIEKIKNGKVDIIIGTHRLLSKDIHFPNLGLIIIDEEQRFGVRAKEHLKKLKKGVDCLTLSATPIPRTLYMSLINIRDMSLIGTPPQDRLPVKIILAERDDEIIKNALQRELARQGQAFFIHNRVETITAQAQNIQKLLPDAKIGVVHGQMTSDDIDKVFHGFKLGQIQILLATTIIENGIDIPNANTILIDRADTYGLADLYQLKGRVGRWNKSAFAYFLIPKKRNLPEIARKRLNALLEAGGYGGGMKIAMRDLQIRGAGDILGVKQSGQVAAIGFHLYCKLLKRTVNALKQKKPVIFTETKMEFPFPAHIPENYIPSASIRMELYHRFGEASNFHELKTLLDEIKDRFGKYPESVLWLYHLSKIRVFASQNQFSHLKLHKYFLYAKRQLPKALQEKRMPLTQKILDPQIVETEVINLLQKNFETTSL